MMSSASASSSTTATSSGSGSGSTAIPASTNIIGGDYAGISATFSSKTGQLVSVPEHLIPSSMLEWGVIPSNLEILTSEDWIPNVDSNGKNIERVTITVLPEVGCGIDNLDVTKKVDKYENSSLKSWQNERHPEREVAAIDRKRGHVIDMETIFQVDSEVNEEEEESKSHSRRIRVSLSIDTSKLSQLPEQSSTVSKLINLQVERQVSKQSTQGTAWSGPKYNSGGLDARTVMKTIGNDIVKGDVFGVKRIKSGGDIWEDLIRGEEEKSLEDILVGPWAKKDTTLSSKDTSPLVEVHRRKENFAMEPNENDTTSKILLRLPQNVFVRYGISSAKNDNMWYLEVSHFNTIYMDGKSHVQLRVVSRSFDTLDVEQNDESSLGIVSYWLEEKMHP